MQVLGYVLISDDLTGLGGPMGTEVVRERWRKNYATAEQAKAAAEKDYGGTIKWQRHKAAWQSPDLRWVMYTIEPLKFEGKR